MPSHSVQPAGRRHLRRMRPQRGRPKHADCLPGMRGTAAMRVRMAVPAAAAFEALIRWALPPVRASGRGGALRGRRQRAPYVGMPGKLGRERPQPGRMPGGRRDFADAGYGRARTGAVCTRDGPRPGAAGIGLPG